MTETQRSVLSTCFSLAIILFALFVTQRFVLPLLWAAILCIATWPLYRRALRMTGGREILAAALVTVVAALVFITPLVLGVASAAHQAPALAQLVASANTEGLAAPEWLHRIPMAGDAVYNWWQATLGQPHGLAHLLQDGSVGRMQSASEVLKRVGSGVLHRLIDVGFAFLCLFFFYKDGRALQDQTAAIGSHLIGAAALDPVRAEGADRGARHRQRPGAGGPGRGRPARHRLPVRRRALGGAVGGRHRRAGHHPLRRAAGLRRRRRAAALPGQYDGRRRHRRLGVVVLFVADHFVRPTIIGNATKLPFLAVLLGILGGVETLGLIGLFVGPVAMTLFVTLWHEEKRFRHAPR
jgi:predicted PurR-regulated permease PerM